MKSSFSSLFFLLLFGAVSVSFTGEPPALPPLKLRMQLISKGLTSPTCMASPHDGTNRLFVTQQNGKIKIIRNGTLLPASFLDLSGRLDGLNIAYSEKGLLGLVFHPDYKTNGRFFVYYSAPHNVKGFNHKSVLAEYRVSKENADVAAMNEEVILEIPEPEANHNGGCMQFGKDGYLYIGVGDGGGAGDQHGETGNGQNLSTWLGKILRIDVNAGALSNGVNSKKPYAVPPDNPFVGRDDAKPEIYAYGLRNPWRFSFDRVTGTLICADVGQDKWEEVNVVEKGKNYGWRIMEGNHCFNPEQDCSTKGLELPVNEYGHELGICIIGGYIYRGRMFPSLHGNYIFGDWTGKLFYLQNLKAPTPALAWQKGESDWQRGEVWVNGNTNNDAGAKINSFAEDENGEIYILTQHFFGPKTPTGAVYRIGY